ncbi:hypothetical protein PIB30_060899 [Stylosanthes scabra]|uniref:Uncharacterized protein n=1 Tax=Stylosanthes scabra TaxID=79078 RepID=A0ABU6VJM6_9FABA|nr:hypothetical protein [Stylosanthes scabra]
MTSDKPSPSAKEKAKAFGPPTRASPRLAALRSQSAVNSQPETPVIPAVPAPATAKRTARMFVKSYSMKLVYRDGPSNIVPTPSFPPKKRLIQKEAGESTSKATVQSFRKQSQRIAALGRPSPNAPKDDSELELALEDTVHEIVEMDEEVEEDPEEDPEEAPQNAGIEEEEEEDPEEDPEEESAAEEVLCGEDNYVDYWALVDFESENAVGDDPRFWNYDGDLLEALLGAAPTHLQQTTRHMIAPQ